MNFSFEWIETTWYADLIKQSRFGFGIVEIFHLFGMVLLLGGIVLVSLRLTGLAMADRPVSEVAASVANWILAGLAMMLVTGVSLWASDPGRFLESEWFWYKMVALLIAATFHFTVYRKATRRNSAPRGTRIAVATIALLVWFGVGFFGRAIGFL